MNNTKTAPAIRFGNPECRTVYCPWEQGQILLAHGPNGETVEADAAERTVTV